MNRRRNMPLYGGCYETMCKSLRIIDRSQGRRRRKAWAILVCLPETCQKVRCARRPVTAWNSS